MHRHCCIYFFACQQLFHLVMAFFIICHFNGRHTICFQSSDIEHINSILCSRYCSCHRILFSVLTSHTGKRNLWSFSKASSLQTLCHLHKSVCNHFFNILCHRNHPLLCHQGSSKIFHSLCDQSFYLFFRYTCSRFCFCFCICLNHKRYTVE